MTTQKQKRGRPKLPGNPAERRRTTQTNISIPKDVRDALNKYREDLSTELEVDLTVAQALKYLIQHAGK